MVGLIDDLHLQTCGPVRHVLDSAERLAVQGPPTDPLEAALQEVRAAGERLLSLLETEASHSERGRTGLERFGQDILELGDAVSAVLGPARLAFAEAQAGPQADEFEQAVANVGSSFAALALAGPLSHLSSQLYSLRSCAAGHAPPRPDVHEVLDLSEHLLRFIHTDVLKPGVAGLDPWDWKRICYQVREQLSPLVGYGELILEEHGVPGDTAHSIRRLLADASWLMVVLDALSAVAMIERRVAYVGMQIRQFLSEFVSSTAPGADGEPRGNVPTPGHPQAYGEPMSLGGVEPEALERFAPQWAAFVPRDPHVRAAIALFLSAKHRLPVCQGSSLHSACGFDEPRTAQAYEQMAGSVLDGGFAPSPSGGSLAEGAGWLSLGRGEVLFRQGDRAGRLYFVVNGRLRLSVRDRDGSERIVGEVSRGEPVDEMAMLMDDRHSASAYALRDSELLTLDRETLESLWSASPELMGQFTRHVLTRLRRALAHPAESGSAANAIAIVPAGLKTPLERFCALLRDALSLHGSVTSMTRAKFERALPETKVDADSAVATSWLNNQEQQHQFVLYAADTAATAWSRRCLRQADRILVVGSTDEGEPLSRTAQLVLEGGLDSEAVRCDLVLLTGSRASTAGCARWRGIPRFSSRYQIDLERPADLQRLARCQVGKGIGLVLGGGAARGYAHIGVLRALEEAGVPVDLIGGTSMGALVAAAHALGWDCTRMVRDLLPPRAVTTDFSFPAVALTRGVRFRDWLHGWVGDRHIEDLPIPFFCVSTNLTRAEAKAHTSGKLLKALMATNALAGLMPPVVEDGDLLVDGGLLANVPWGVMQAIPDAGCVIAVDTVPPVELAENHDYGLGLSGWRVLGERLMSRKRRAGLPGILSIELRAHQVPSLAARKNLRHGPNDLFLPLSLEKFSFLDYKRIREIAEEGYRCAAPLIADWKRRVLVPSQT